MELQIGNVKLIWLTSLFRCRKVKYGHEATAEKAVVAMNAKTGDDYDAWHIGHAR